MNKNILKEWRRKITKSLPERQVLMRSDGYVRFFLLSTTNQVIIIAAITSIAVMVHIYIIKLYLGLQPSQSALEGSREDYVKLRRSVRISKGSRGGSPKVVRYAENKNLRKLPTLLKKSTLS